MLWKIATRKLEHAQCGPVISETFGFRRPMRLEALQRSWTGYHAIRTNDRYRIVFRWIEGNAKNVLITDYH